MQTKTFNDADADVAADAGISELNPVQSPEVPPIPEQYSQALAQLETDVANLQAAFVQLEHLQDAEKEAAVALEQTVGEERSILSSVDLSESQAVKRLCEVRARRDLRTERLTEAPKEDSAPHRSPTV